MSRGLGFIREMVIAHFFTRLETDVFYAALRLPNLFRRIFGEGALTVNFIPVFGDYLNKRDEEGAKRFAGAVFTFLVLVLSIITVAGIFWADSITKEFTPGYASVAGKMELSIHQTKIMIGYVILVSIYAFFMGMLNTFQVFWLPAAAPALWNLTLITAALFFRNSFEVSSDALAWGVLGGGVLQMVVLIPPLIKRGYLPRFQKFWAHPGVRQVLLGMVPSIIGLSGLQILVLVNTHFASQLEPGSNTWIAFADRLLELPLALFSVSIGTAALPTLHSLWAQGKRSEMIDTSLHGMKLSLFMAIPCSIAFLFFSHPLVEVLFQHGEFKNYDTLKTASILEVYAFTVLISGVVRILVPCFYAIKLRMIPPVATLISVGIHLLIVGPLMEKSGVVGLATSTVISSGVNLLLLLVAFRYWIGPMSLVSLIGTLIKITLASFVMGATTLLYDPILGIFSDPGHIQKVLTLVTVIGFACLTYVLMCLILNVQEFLEIKSAIQRRLNRR